MYTLTRKLTMVCLAMVLSVLAYGCGGGSSQPALVVTEVNTDTVTTGLTPDSGTYPIQPGGTANAGDVAFACEGSPCEVTVADDGTVTSTGGMVTAMTSDSAVARVAAVEAARVAEDAQAVAEQAQQDAEDARDVALLAQQDAEDARDAALLAQGGAEGDKTAAEQLQQDAEDARDVALLAQQDAEDARDAALLAEAAALLAEAAAKERARQLTMVTQIKPDLAGDFDKVTAGTHTLPSGDVMEIDDVRIECPAAAGIPCTVVIIVDSDGMASYTSLGGVATVVNTGAVTRTRMAIALTGARTAEDDGALNTKAMAGEDGAPLNTVPNPIGVKRNPGGTTTITPVHVADAMDEVKYESVAVDSHRITGWIGKTLTRDDGIEETDEIDAVPALNRDEATFYTNIESAESGKLKYKAGLVPTPGADGVMVFAVDPGQDAEDFTDEFTGSYIRKSDGSKIRGSFTCIAEVCTPVVVPTTTSDEGNLVLLTPLALGWIFESDVNVPEGEIHDTNYMYFGYWLKSPVVVSDSASSYQYATLAGGNALFVVGAPLTDALGRALTAKFEGGAAGRYVTRELRVEGGEVDPSSPGSHGRFTAKAALTAYFGGPTTGTEEVLARRNMIHGTISDFKNGSIDLGFEVTLEMLAIEESVGGINHDNVSSTVTAKFGQNSDNGPTTGRWSAEFYGANAAEGASDAVINRTLPSGVAGEFDVGTITGFTKVVGAFAAERTQ